MNNYVNKTAQLVNISRTRVSGWAASGLFQCLLPHPKMKRLERGDLRDIDMKILDSVSKMTIIIYI